MAFPATFRVASQHSRGQAALADPQAPALRWLGGHFGTLTHFPIDSKPFFWLTGPMSEPFRPGQLPNPHDMANKVLVYDADRRWGCTGRRKVGKDHGKPCGFMLVGVPGEPTRIMCANSDCEYNKVELERPDLAGCLVMRRPT